MHRHRRLCFLSTICVVILASVAVAQSNANEEVQLGKQALSQGKYDEAIEHFNNASMMAPRNIYMELNMAGAFAQAYVPGGAGASNAALADQAIAHYQKILDADLSRGAALTAAKGIALLKAQMNKFDESKDYYRRAKELDPQDPEPFYFTALIDWTLASQVRKQARTKLGLKPQDSLAAKDPKVCAEVRDKNLSNLAEALDNLNKALELRPTYADAMTYMNLSYVERADIQCDDPASRQADLKTADDWQKKLWLLKQQKKAPPEE